MLGGTASAFGFPTHPAHTECRQGRTLTGLEKVSWHDGHRSASLSSSSCFVSALSSSSGTFCGRDRGRGGREEGEKVGQSNDSAVGGRVVSKQEQDDGKGKKVAA